MKLDCSCTVVAGAIQRCKPHTVAFSLIGDIATIVSAPKAGIPKALTDKLDPLAVLLADLQGPEECVVATQNGRDVIRHCRSHQAAYSLAGLLMDIEDGSKIGLTGTIATALITMAPTIDTARFK